MQGCPALSPKELKLALRKLQGRHRLRNRALVILGVRSGLRISELLSLRVGQVWDGDKPVSRFYLKRRATKGKTTGASILLHPDAAVALTRWIAGAELRDQPGSYLFPSQKNQDQPLDRRSAWRLLHRAFRLAGVAGMAGSHCLRKTFAARIHKALGGDLFRTSKALRHTSPMTTLKYLSFKQDEIDRAILAA